jgi:putative endonuclease
MYYVYVIEDETNKLYKGYTNNLERRLKEHQSGHTQTTSRMCGKLKIKYFETVETLNEALIREKYFKSAAGRRYLTKVWARSSSG